jgi:L-arabinose isomerase
MDKHTQEIWFLTGSQHLYGPKTLQQVAADSQEIAAFLEYCGKFPVKVAWKPILTGPDEILDICLAANSAPECIGVITWMHTFSPAKMWIAGLTHLQKPMAHLHTQYNRDLPWDQIDMDFMNLNQSAHGDREFGFMGARLRLNNKVVVGYWKDPAVLEELGAWGRSARAMGESRRLKVARFGGTNMREVAVTGGDRVEAQIKLGWAVNGHPMGDLAKVVGEVDDAAVDKLIQEYEDLYDLAPALAKGGAQRSGLRNAARQELGMRAYLQAGRFGAFTTTFEDLHGFDQLPGLACQRLMAEGYGFAAEGDWKTAALVRLTKVMAEGQPRSGVSFMEDYTYHLEPGRERVLGAHMLEVCPSIASGKPSLEVHRLGIGGKADPCRLVFDAASGPAVNACLIDLGGRMRLITAELDVVSADHAMPKLPVASAVWIPRPDFKRGCQAWILAGGAHHASFSYGVGADLFEDFAAMAGIEFVRIDAATDLRALRNELRWNEETYR